LHYRRVTGDSAKEAKSIDSLRAFWERKTDPEELNHVLSKPDFRPQELRATRSTSYTTNEPVRWATNSPGSSRQMVALRRGHLLQIMINHFISEPRLGLFGIDVTTKTLTSDSSSDSKLKAKLQVATGAPLTTTPGASIKVQTRKL